MQFGAQLWMWGLVRVVFFFWGFKSKLPPHASYRFLSFPSFFLSCFLLSFFNHWPPHPCPTVDIPIRPKNRLVLILKLPSEKKPFTTAADGRLRFWIHNKAWWKSTCALVYPPNWDYIDCHHGERCVKGLFPVGFHCTIECPEVKARLKFNVALKIYIFISLLEYKCVIELCHFSPNEKQKRERCSC